MTDLGTYTLNDGTTVPRVGFGTYPLRGEEGIAAMTSALDVGYRYLDSAVNYENETEVGEAVRRSGIARDEITVATKIPGRCHAHDLAVQSVEDSLRRMRFDRLDVVLIHWPNPGRGLFVEAWQALVDCRERGLVRTIGVSNFTPAHLEAIVEATGVVPAVNQVELHPAFAQSAQRAADRGRGVLTQAWSPLGRADADGPFGSEAVRAAAQAHDVTPGQVILRWELQLGVMPLPKSGTRERQEANLDLGFELTREEMAAIATLDRPDGRLFDADPDTHEEM